LRNAAPLPEGAGKPVYSTALPALTWVGEKLRPDYLSRILTGHEDQKPHPWLVARMPGFANLGDRMAMGLAHQQGFGPVRSEPAPNPEKVAAGKALVGENGGFNCVQCHILGNRAATAAFEAPGPDLGSASRRWREEYFLRWGLAPTRVDPETKMPKFADEQGRTPLTQYFHGEAKEQFDAIWEYLRTISN
jgi:mono/diheme cytochrome c family protein